MARSRWIVSAFLVWHLTALVIGAIPRPETLSRFQGSSRPEQRPFQSVGAFFDRLADQFANLPDRLLSPIPRVLVRVAGTYLNSLGMSQRWDMFTAPQRENDYLRIRFYVIGAQDDSLRGGWSLTRLVFPMGREDQLRGMRSLSAFAHDRTFATALEWSHQPHMAERGSDPQAFQDALQPAVRVLVRHFERAFVRRGERLVRVELWHTTLSSSAPGASAANPRPAFDAISDYYAEPVQQPLVASRFPRLFAVERERELVWRLEYVEQR